MPKIGDFNVAHTAMCFAMKIHENQKRKYTGLPYWNHLAEVAGLISTLYGDEPVVIATSWLHDCMEDCNVGSSTISINFGEEILYAVRGLSDLEEGNRQERNKKSIERLILQPYWVQDIKICDLISNTSSIVEYDPKFASIYLEEKKKLLNHLTKGNPLFMSMAKDIIREAEEKLKDNE